MKLTFRDLLSTLFHYSRALTIFWVVTLIAALIFFSQSRKLYESKSKIMILLGSEAFGKTDYLRGGILSVSQREQQIHNEEQILESHEVALTAALWIVGDSTPRSGRTVMNQRVDQARQYLTGVAPEPTFLLRLIAGASQISGQKKAWTHDEVVENVAQSIAKSLTVKAVVDSDTLEAKVRTADPRVSQTVLRLIIDAYLEHHIDIFENSAEAKLLKSQLDRSVGDYHQQLSDFSAYMGQHQIYSDDSQVNQLVEEREKLKLTLNDSLSDSEAAQARLAVLTSFKQSLEKMARYSTTETRNKERESLLSKLNDMRVEEQALLTRHPKGSRAYEEEEAKLDVLRGLLAQQPEEVLQQTEQRRTQASELVDSEIVNVTEMERGAQARIARVGDSLKYIESKIGNYEKNLEGFDALKLQVSFAKHESERMSEVYVDSRLKSLTAQNGITDISEIDLPTYNGQATYPTTKVEVAGVSLLLAVGTLAILLISFGLDSTVSDSASAEWFLGAPVAITLPMHRAKGHGRLLPEQFARENYREFARIYQLLRSSGTEGKIIVLAESGSKEGGSLVGLSLATFLSKYPQEKVAFIDWTENRLAELKAGSLVNPQEPVILPWAFERAPAMDGGEEPVTLPWAFERTPAREGENDPISALSRLRREYSYIVISSGPVKDSTALLAISGATSATFLIVEAGKTRREAARFSLETMRRYGFSNAKLILNKRRFYIPNWLMRYV